VQRKLAGTVRRQTGIVVLAVVFELEQTEGAIVQRGIDDGGVTRRVCRVAPGGDAEEVVRRILVDAAGRQPFGIADRQHGRNGVPLRGRAGHPRDDAALRGIKAHVGDVVVPAAAGGVKGDGLDIGIGVGGVVAAVRREAAEFVIGARTDVQLACAGGRQRGVRRRDRAGIEVVIPGRPAPRRGGGGIERLVEQQFVLG